MPKKILVTIIIILLLFIFSTQSHATTINNIPNTDIYQEYKTIVDADWYNLLYINLNIAKSNNGEFNADFKRFCSVVTTRSTWYYWWVSNDKKSEYFLDSSRQPISTDVRTIMYGIASLDDITFTDSGITTVIPGSINSSATVSREWKLLSPSQQTPYISKISFSGFTPTVTGNIRGYMRVPEGFQQYCPTDIYDDIYRIGRGEFSISSIDTKIQEISETLTDTNEFIQDDTVDQYTQNDLPQSNMTDPTESTFNGIFNRLYTAISNDSYHSVTIPLKFGQWDKSFSLNSNSLDFMRGDRNRDLVAFIELIWSFIIYYYILRDIYNMVNDLSQGKIAEKVDNIKTQLL